MILFTKYAPSSSDSSVIRRTCPHCALRTTRHDSTLNVRVLRGKRSYCTSCNRRCTIAVCIAYPAAAGMRAKLGPLIERDLIDLQISLFRRISRRLDELRKGGMHGSTFFMSTVTGTIISFDGADVDIISESVRESNISVTVRRIRRC